MRVLVAFLMAMPAFSQMVPLPVNGGPRAALAPCTPYSGRARCVELDIDPTKVGGSNLTDFPVATKVSAGPLTFASGAIQSSVGYDVVYTSDAGGTTLLNWKHAYVNAGSNQIISYVKIPTTSASVTTKFWASWDKSGVVSDPSPGSPWSGTSLWPLSDGTTLSMVDIAGGLTATNHGAVAAAGTVDGAADLAGVNYITAPAINPASITVSVWAYSTNFNQNGVLLANNINSQWQLWFEGGALQWRGASAGAPQISTSLPSNSNWHYIVATQTGTSAVLYVDGSAVTSGTCVAIGTTGTSIDIGSFLGGAFWQFSGILDEPRIINAAVVAGQVLAEFNNQKPSSDLLSVGAGN